MTKNLRIAVTQSDLETGEKKNTARCAIANAINRLYPEYTHVRVTEPEISFSDKKRRTRYTLATPLTARKLIQKFDKGQYADSMSFEIRLEEALTKPMADNTVAVREKRRAYMKTYEAPQVPSRRRNLR